MAARRAREAVTRRTIAPLPPKLLTLVFRSLAVAHLHTGGLILGRIYQDLSTFNKSVYISCLPFQKAFVLSLFLDFFRSARKGGKGTGTG